MEHFGWLLTTSASGRTVVPPQCGAFMRALNSIWEIPAKENTRFFTGDCLGGIAVDVLVSVSDRSNRTKVRKVS